MTESAKVTDYMIERAMSDPACTPFERARNVSILFARRIGRVLSEEEIDETARHLMKHIILSGRREGEGS